MYNIKEGCQLRLFSMEEPTPEERSEVTQLYTLFNNARKLWIESGESPLDGQWKYLMDIVNEIALRPMPKHFKKLWKTYGPIVDPTMARLFFPTPDEKAAAKALVELSKGTKGEMVYNIMSSLNARITALECRLI